MKLTEIITRLSLDVFTSVSDSDAEATGGYCGDLLSHVLTSASPGDVWMTIQHHANVVAVAQVVGLAAVVMVDGKRPDEATCRQAEAAGVVLLGSIRSAFDTCVRLNELLVARR